VGEVGVQLGLAVCEDLELLAEMEIGGLEGVVVFLEGVEGGLEVLVLLLEVVVLGSGFVDLVVVVVKFINDLGESPFLLCRLLGRLAANALAVTPHRPLQLPLLPQLPLQLLYLPTEGLHHGTLDHGLKQLLHSHGCELLGEGTLL
jgi:hypothetical protein